MITLDESTLIAYVDGELDAETVRMVEDKLCTDEHATNYVERLREIAALSRIAFNDTLHEAVPQTLRDTVLNAATVKGGDADNVVVFAPSRAHNDWGRALPMAAAVACLLLGLGGGYQYSQTSAEHALKLASMTLQQDQSSMELALNQALEVKMTGDAQTWTNPDTRRSATFTPVNTYQDQSGAFCREYRKDFNTKDQSETTFGLACRDDKGTWKTRYLILDNSNNQKF
jgi:surface antigen